MLKSKDTFSLSSEFTIENLREKLLSLTLQRKSLVVEKTDRFFIGQVDDEGFRIIGANPTDSLCVVNGQFKIINAKTEYRLKPVCIRHI